MRTDDERNPHEELSDEWWDFERDRPKHIKGRRNVYNFLRAWFVCSIVFILFLLATSPVNACNDLHFQVWGDIGYAINKEKSLPEIDFGKYSTVGNVGVSAMYRLSPTLYIRGGLRHQSLPETIQDHGLNQWFGGFMLLF